MIETLCKILQDFSVNKNQNRKSVYPCNLGKGGGGRNIVIRKKIRQSLAHHFSFSNFVCLLEYCKNMICYEWFFFFSLAVFGENARYCYSLGILVIVMQKLWHFVISVITEGTFLKLGICVHYPKSNLYYQGRQFKMHFFLFRIMPLFGIKTFYPLSST